MENKEKFNPVLKTAKELLTAQGKNDIVIMLNDARISVSQTGYDNWNGGIYYYTVYIDVSVSTFVRLNIETIQKDIAIALNTATRYTESEVFSQVIISPKSNSKIDWNLIDLSKQELEKKINYLKNTMISVSTGGQRIQNVEQSYKQAYKEVNQELNKLNIENPNNYDSLWSWYGKWSNDFPHYQERRDYINEMYKQLINIFLETEKLSIIDIKVNLSDWERINRTIIEIKKREQQAQNEEQFQAIGMLCRELIITLAQFVYKKDIHPSIDGIEISKTDAKRMLESYISVTLLGKESEELRAYAKTTNNLANTLTHKRTATKKEMMLCISATLALINFIGVLEDKI